MEDANTASVALPFSLFIQGNHSGSEIQNSNILFFPGTNDFKIETPSFHVHSQALSKVKERPILQNGNFETNIKVENIPVFSIVAILILVLLRNLFFTSFQKYFLSIRNNYEIDFSIQKIGFVPLLMSLLIILFSFSNILSTPQSYWFSNANVFLRSLELSFDVLTFPILISVFIFFMLNFSIRLFPLIFSDIKALFGISIIVLVWNFFVFGSDIEKYLPIKYFLLSIGVLFLIIRSVLFLSIFRRAYRFRMPITLFYICTLNLGTFLLFCKGLWIEIFRLL